MGLMAFGRSITNFTRLVDACIRMLERDHRDVEDNFRITIVHPMTIGCGILFVPPSVVVDIFVRIGTKSLSVRALEPEGVNWVGLRQHRAL